MSCDSQLTFVENELDKEIKKLNDTFGNIVFVKDDNLLMYQSIKLLLNLTRINASLDSAIQLNTIKNLEHSSSDVKIP